MKPWPTDVLIIVAAKAGTLPLPDSVVIAWCRDCQCVIHGCPLSLQAALDNPHRHGRLIAYLCEACIINYDLESIHKFYGANGLIAQKPGLN